MHKHSTLRSMARFVLVLIVGLLLLIAAAGALLIETLRDLSSRRHLRTVPRRNPEFLMRSYETRTDEVHL